VLILHPAKVATPELVALGLAVQLSVAPAMPVPLVIASVTELESVVIAAPEEFSTVTAG
jgi:hypothetical protein